MKAVCRKRISIILVVVKGHSNQFEIQKPIFTVHFASYNTEEQSCGSIACRYFLVKRTFLTGDRHAPKPLRIQWIVSS